MTTGLRDQLAMIHQAHGKLTPHLVLETARDPQHPLHSRFEWNDSLAAERYRLAQAHELIRSVRVVYRSTQGERSVRAFQAVRAPTGYVYEPAEKVLRDPFTTQLILNEMRREWEQLRARYEDFKEFAEMVRADINEAA